jgi:hypothetical protein
MSLASNDGKLLVFEFQCMHFYPIPLGPQQAPYASPGLNFRIWGEAGGGVGRPHDGGALLTASDVRAVIGPRIVQYSAGLRIDFSPRVGVVQKYTSIS